MEESNALHRLTEAADLIRMVEELTAPSAFEKLSSSSIAGMRITLRNIRETVLSSHDTLAENLVNRSRLAGERAAIPAAPANGLTKPATTILTPETSKIDSVNLLDNATSARANLTDRQTNASFTRRDLRASLEKLADR